MSEIKKISWNDKGNLRFDNCDIEDKVIERVNEIGDVEFISLPYIKSNVGGNSIPITFNDENYTYNKDFIQYYDLEFSFSDDEEGLIYDFSINFSRSQFLMGLYEIQDSSISAGHLISMPGTYNFIPRFNYPFISYFQDYPSSDQGYIGRIYIPKFYASSNVSGNPLRIRVYFKFKRISSNGVVYGPYSTTLTYTAHEIKSYKNIIKKIE